MRLEAGATVEDSLLFQGVTVGEGAKRTKTRWVNPAAFAVLVRVDRVERPAQVPVAMRGAAGVAWNQVPGRARTAGDWSVPTQGEVDNQGLGAAGTFVGCVAASPFLRTPVRRYSLREVMPVSFPM